MKQKHNGYLDGTLTLTHEVLMAFAKAHFDYLKNMGQWGAKSLDNEKIVAMAAEINALKGQLKLDPKLSAIAKDKKKEDKGENKGKKKNKKDTSNKKYQKKDHVLTLEKNIYGQKQAGHVWNSFLVDKLVSLGFTPSLIDDCVFFRDDIIFMVYVDDDIFLGNDDSKLHDAIKEIQDSGLNIEDQGHPADYVGVNIKKLRDGSYEFTQRTLIDAIIDDVRLKDAKVKPVPAKVSLKLHAFKEEPPFDPDFN